MGISSRNRPRDGQPAYFFLRRRLRKVDWQQVPHSGDIEVSRTYNDGSRDIVVQSHAEFVDSVFKGLKTLKKLCDDEKKNLLLVAAGLVMTAAVHSACCPGCPLCLHIFKWLT